MRLRVGRGENGGVGGSGGSAGTGGIAGTGGTGGSPPSIELTIVSDNLAVDDRLATAWGYACVVRGLSRPILFDTGPDGTKLLANMEKLSLDPGALDVLFLSHAHADHIGGVVPFLRAAPPSDVYLLESFPSALKDAFAAEGATVHEVAGRDRIMEHAYSLGQLGMEIPEQALVIDDADGLIVVTGCAHPAIAHATASLADRLWQARRSTDPTRALLAHWAHGESRISRY
jgi:metal-dependent hydrolase (beta-lactamase superfamily II)